MERLENLDISLIDDPERPMRSATNNEALQELAQSIREHGIIEPLVVRKKGGRFEVIAGHRRLAAAGIARLSKVPAIVRVADDRETIILRMHENLIREDVDPVSEAKFIAHSIKDLGVNLEEFSHLLKRGQQYVEDRLTIAEMPDYLQEALTNKEIRLGVALELFRIDVEAWRVRYVQMAKNDGMTVAQARACREQYEDTKQRAVEAGLEIPVESLPVVPPQIVAQCAKCGVTSPIQEMQFIRIHSVECLNP